MDDTGFIQIFIINTTDSNPEGCSVYSVQSIIFIDHHYKNKLSIQSTGRSYLLNMSFVKFFLIPHIKIIKSTTTNTCPK